MNLFVDQHHWEKTLSECHSNGENEHEKQS